MRLISGLYWLSLICASHEVLGVQSHQGPSFLHPDTPAGSSEDVVPKGILLTSILPTTATAPSNDGNFHFYIGSKRCMAGVLVFGNVKCYATNRGGWDSHPPDSVTRLDSSGRPCSYIPPAKDGNQ